MQRAENTKKEILAKKMDSMKDTIVKLGIDKRMVEEDDDEKAKAPVDIEFELGFNPPVNKRFQPLD